MTDSIKIANNTRVSLKLTLHRSRGVEMHRFSGNYDYAALCSAIAEVWGTVPKLLRISYVDNEGDEITVSTQREWDECLDIHCVHEPAVHSTVNPIKLTVRRGAKLSKKKVETVAAPARSGDESDEDTPRCENSSTRASSCPASAVATQVPRLHLSKTRGCCASGQPRFELLSMTVQSPVATTPSSALPSIFSPTGPAQPAVFQAATECLADSRDDAAAERARTPMEEPLPGAPFYGDGAGIAALRLISLLYKCDAVKEITSQQSTAPFLGTIVRVDFNPATFEAHIDVNQLELRREVVVRTNVMLDEHRTDEAHDVLRAACDLFPRDTTILYNLACVSAIMYEPQRAMQYLRRAVDAGYDNPDHLEGDDDLQLLRGDPEFRSLVAVMRAQQGQPVARVVPMIPVSEPVPEQTVVQPPVVFEEEPRQAAPEPPREIHAPEPVREVAPEPVIQQPVAPAEPIPLPSQQSAQRLLPAEVRQLLSMFPALDAGEAAEFLRRTRNDVRRAVAIILGDAEVA